MAEANLALNLLLRDTTAGGLAAFTARLLSSTNSLKGLGTVSEQAALKTAQFGLKVDSAAISLEKKVLALDKAEAKLTALTKAGSGATQQEIAFAQVERDVAERELDHAYAAQKVLGAESAAADAVAKHTVQMQQLGGALAGVGAAFGLLLAGTLTAASAAEDLDYAMAKVELRVKGATDVLPQMTREIQRLAVQSIYGSTDVAQAFETLGSDAFTAQQILNGLGQESIWLGQMMGTTASQGADLLGSTLHIFANEGLNATQAANILAGAFTNGVKTADGLQAALDNAGGTASMLGVKLQDLTTVLSILGQAGLPAEQAGTSLRYVLGALSNPTLKAAKELGNLGITLIQTTNPALLALEDKMRRAGGSAAGAVTDFDASTTGLNDLFKAAQKAHLIPLDQDFNSWAFSTGIMSNQLYDAQGNFKGLGAAVEMFKQAVEAKFPNNAAAQAAALEQIFNVRGGKGMMILEALQNFHDKYNTTWDNIGKTDAAQKAQRLMDTMKGAIDALKDSFTSFMAAVGTNWIDWIKGAALGLNNFIGYLQDSHPEILKFLAILLPAGTLITGLALGVGALTVAFTLLGPALVPLLAAFGIAMGGAAVIAAIGAAMTQANPAGGAFADWLTHAKSALETMGIKLPGTTDKVKTFKGKVDDTNGSLDTMDNRLKNVKKRLDAIDQQFDDTNKKIDKTPTALDTATDSIGKFIKDALDRLGPELALVRAGLELDYRIWTVLWPDMANIAGDALDLVIGELQIFGDYLGGFTLAMIDILNNDWGKAWQDWQNAGKAAQDHSIQQSQRWGKLFNDSNKASMDYLKAISIDGYHQSEQASSDFVSKITKDAKKAGDAIGAMAGETKSAMSAAAASTESGGAHIESAINSHYGAAEKEARSHLAGMKNDAHKWGVDIGENLASGLRSQLHNVGEAAGSLAGAIAGYLHHSEPDMGPLVGDSKWGAEFAQNLAFGMTSQLPLVSSAASRVASTMAFTPAVGSVPSGGGGGGLPRASTTHVHIHVGSKEVASVVMDDFTKQLRSNGGGRVFR